MNEHDKLFKYVEGIKENAQDLIEGIFPKDILAELDLSTMEIDNNSYVSENLSEFFSDVVYNCKTSQNKDLKITLLFEHKSYKPKNEYLQLLQYLLNIWNFQEKNKEDLSIVIPIIFYHGKDKWEYRSFESFFTNHESIFQKFIPDFYYILADIVRQDDEFIKNQMFKREFNRVLALLFKYFSEKELTEEKIVYIFTELKKYLDDEQMHRIIAPYMVYIFEITDYKSDDLEKMFTQISVEGGKTIMSTAMRLREEGMNIGFQKGIEKGIEKGKIDDARKMLADGLTLEKISYYTDLSISDIEKLK